MIKLKFYEDNPQDNELVAGYQLQDPTYTATPQQALAQAKADENRMPILALHDGEAAGFFVLVKGQEATANGADPKTTLVIRSLSVSETHRRQGVATQMMRALPAFVELHFPWAKELILGRDEGNVAAKNLYASLGYEDTGRRREGRYGKIYVLSYQLG